MRTKIFIAFTNPIINERVRLKKMKFHGKEYQGIIAEKDLLSLKEIIEAAETHGQNSSHILLIPIVLIG